MPNPMESVYLQGEPRDRHQGDTRKRLRESEPPIVVGDGNTDHTASHRYAGASKAKGMVGEQRGQSTHARERNTPENDVSRTLSALEAKARKDPKHRFRGLARLLNREMLQESFIRLIVKWLKAGVMEEGSNVIHPATGTPQGGVISPILANIYLHYIQDEWIAKVVSKHSKGKVLFRRYADEERRSN